MTRSDCDFGCRQARIYYHDLLNDETKAHVPEDALRHIVQCRACQEQIDRLESLLMDADKQGDDPQSQRNSALGSVLELHFRLAGRSVTCSSIKSFLASLAVPSLQIKIPTPVTVHIDHCQACADDLLQLRNLGLTHSQLYRLGRILAEKRPQEGPKCRQGRAAVPEIAKMDLVKTAGEVLQHVSTCRDCRQLLYQQREKIRAELPAQEAVAKGPACSDVSGADIFDYCFPCGIEPADSEQTKAQAAFAWHALRCPSCLARVQQCHRTICDIAERSECEVTTRFDFKEHADAAAESELDELYADWQVKVEVLEESVPAAQIIPFSTMIMERSKRLNVRRFVRPAAAAAAILIACVWFFSTAAAKAVELGQIYEAVERMRNVCILRFRAGESEPKMKEWISQDLKVRLQEKKNQVELWDAASRVRTVKVPASGSITTTTVSAQVAAKLEAFITDGRFGLMPFFSRSDVPEQAQWCRVDETTENDVLPGAEVYDLDWQVSMGPVMEYNRWRVLVDTSTNLPQRTETYNKLAPDAQWELTAVLVVRYPGESEIRTMIEQLFE